MYQPNFWYNYSMKNLLDLVVTVRKDNLKDSYHPEFSPFSVKLHQHLTYDDDKNELIVKLPTGKIRKVKMLKSYMETFTDYV